MNMEKFDWWVVLALATSSMLLQQALAYVCQIVMPFLADRIAEEFGISRAWLGLYLFIQNIAAIAAAMGCGALIVKLGPLRISQYCLVFMGGSLFVIATGVLWLYPVAAILLGAASVSTPASSHILARFCPPRLAPLIFSVKQTGVPVGALIGGLLIPALLGLGLYSATLRESVHLDAFGTAFVCGLLVYSVAVMLQPLRAHFDSDRKPDTKFSVSGAAETMRIVVHDAKLRDLAFLSFALGGLQAIWSGFFILFLIDRLDYSELEAGTAFAIASVTAIFARILWGYLGSTIVSPRLVLGMLCVFAAISAILTGFYSTGWSLNAIIGVAIVYNITSLSWHGVLLAETARLAPEGHVGGITGGVLAFTSVAMMIYPAIYGGLLAATDSYGIGFILAAGPAMFCAVVFFNKPLEGSWVGTILHGFGWVFHPLRLAVFGLLTLASVAGAAMLVYRSMV
ncbi:MAG: MFS transporter [Alphaproteobacteria bacterium]|nr:MFS transporter [Alphaproteobacteria bacterium]